MIELTTEELKQRFSDNIFGRISETADELGLECYVVGGYVRDIFLQRPSKDIDVVVVGSGIAMAEALAKRLGRGAHLSVFKNFGTAQLKYHGTEVEFVGARKESYTHDSRKPVVEDGSLEDDQNRRDFTIMPWRSASTGSVMESWWILSEEWRTCVKRPSARRSIRTLPSVTIPCV